MKYRLESNTSDPDHPYLVHDEQGEDYLFVLYEQLRFHWLRAHDHQKHGERILNEIQSELRKRAANPRRSGRRRSDDCRM